jgi:hypothetical protein
VRHILRKRNGNGQQQQMLPPPPQQPAPLPAPQLGEDEAENTGRFMFAIQNASDDTLREFSRAAMASIDARPATRGETKQIVQECVDSSVDRLRTELNGERKQLSASVEHTRDRLDGLIEILPCQAPDPADCDIVKVPYPLPGASKG